MNLSFKSFLSVFCLSSVVSPSNAREMMSDQEEATEGRYDYQAVLVKSDGSFGTCGGILIAPEYVLTHSSCAYDYTKVQLGRHDLSDDNEEYEEINIASVIIDSGSSNSTELFDFVGYQDTVAIMKLEEESSIEAVTFDTGSADLTPGSFSFVTILGWGLWSKAMSELSLDAPVVEIGGLLETEATIATPETCEALFSSLTDSSVCTERTDYTDTAGSLCQTDVGSAIIEKGSSSSEDVLIGVDAGFGCSTVAGVVPGYFYAVNYYNDFIDCVLDGGEEACGETVVPGEGEGDDEVNDWGDDNWWRDDATFVDDGDDEDDEVVDDDVEEFPFPLNVILNFGILFLLCGL